MQHISLPSLTTTRLSLRQLAPTDDEVIFALRNNKQVNAFIKRPLLNSIYDARNFINAINSGINNNEWLYWAIILKENEQLIGTICLWHFSFDNASDEATAEIGYELHPNYQGAGLMNEALQTVIRYGLTALQLKTIEAFTQPDNVSSIKLLEKNSFIYDAGHNNSYSPTVRFVLHNS